MDLAAGDGNACLAGFVRLVWGWYNIGYSRLVAVWVLDGVFCLCGCW